MVLRPDEDVLVFCVKNRGFVIRDYFCFKPSVEDEVDGRKGSFYAGRGSVFGNVSASLKA